MRFAPVVLISLPALVLCACSAAVGSGQQSPRAQQELAEALSGRTAGSPQRCISNDRANSMQVIDDYTLLYRDGRTIWVQKPRGGCTGLGIGGNTLVTRQFGTSQICDGDINHTVDLRTGMMGSACVFGPFTPYTKP